MTLEKRERQPDSPGAVGEFQARDSGNGGQKLNPGQTWEVALAGFGNRLGVESEGEAGVTDDPKCLYLRLGGQRCTTGYRSKRRFKEAKQGVLFQT